MATKTLSLSTPHKTTSQPVPQPPKIASRQTLEQQRAQDAWLKSYNCSSDYRNAAKGLPALIMTSGLMQVLAFCESKDGANKDVATHLRQWLCFRYGMPQTTSFTTFMEHLMWADPRQFQAITTEAHAWLRWLRQMASAQ